LLFSYKILTEGENYSAEADKRCVKNRQEGGIFSRIVFLNTKYWIKESWRIQGQSAPPGGLMVVAVGYSYLLEHCPPPCYINIIIPSTDYCRFFLCG
jgi:hypothetical protein